MTDFDEQPDEEPVRYRATAADGSTLIAAPPSGAGMSAVEWLDGARIVRPSRWNSEVPALLAIPAGIDVLRGRTAKPRAVIGYRRTFNDSPLSIRLPEHVDAADWDAYRDSLGSTSDGDPIADAWYERIHAEQQHETVEIPLSGYRQIPFEMIDADAAVDPDTDWGFDPNPAYLVFGAEFAHHFPGSVTGIRAAAAKALNEVPGVTVWTHKLTAREPAITGTATVQYEDGRTHLVDAGPRTRKRKSVLSTASVPFSWLIPDTVAGASKADAAARADQAVADLVARASELRLVMCSHCAGAGVLPVGARL